MTGIYVRVSTINQKDNISYQTQEEEGIAYAKSVGDSFLVYKEAQSGKKVEARTEFQRLLADIERGKIDKIYVYNQDRIARNTIDGLNFIQTLKKHSIKLIINGKEWDYDDSSTYMILTVIFATAEKQGTDIVTYSKDRLHAKINRGEQPFSRLFGYRFKYNSDGSKSWSVDEDEARIIRLVYDMFFQGKSFNSIKHKLNERAIPSRFGTTWTTSQICRLLEKPVYSGWVYNTEGELIRSKVHSEEIVSLDEWKRVQYLWKTRYKQEDIFVRSVHVASTIIGCGDCGASYIHRWQKWGNPRKAKRQYFARHKKGCSNPYHHMDGDMIDDILTALYLHEFQSYETVQALFDDKRNEVKGIEQEKYGDIEALEKQIKELNRRKQNLVNAIADVGMDADLSKALGEVRQAITDLESKIEQVKKDVALLNDDFASLLDEFSDESISNYIEADDAGRNLMLHKAIEFSWMVESVLVVKFITGSDYYIPLDDVPDWLMQECYIVAEFRNEVEVKETARIARLRLWDQEMARLQGGQ